MITLIDLTHWVQRINATCPLFANRAFEGLTVSDVAIQLIGTPLAAVSVAEEESQPSLARDSVMQPHSYQVAVKIAVPKTYSRTDHLGGADAQLIRACRLELLNGLLGWLPPDAKGRVEHASGSLAEQPESWIWTDLFTTKDQLRKPHG